MTNALQTPTTVVCTDNETELRSGRWLPPRNIPADMQREAIHALGVLKVRTGRPSLEVVETFIAHLANMCAGRDLPPEEKLFSAVSAILRADYPAILFSDTRVLDRIARRFVFWPGWSELANALDDELARLRTERTRLEIIAKGKPKAPAKDVREEEPWTGPRQMSAVTQSLLTEAYAKMEAAAEEMRHPLRMQKA